MAAELDYSNDRVNYAYAIEHGSVWHGEGQIVPLHSPLHVWKKEAGMEWFAKESVITYTDNEGNTVKFPKKKALYRGDNNAPLSVVGSDYKLVQPPEIIDFFSDVLEAHDMEMSSCGSLFGGRRFFATAKLNNMEIIPGDTINGYLLIATSLDGSFATVAKTTSVRTVCNNTLTMALRESSANVIKVPHSTTFDATKAKLNLGLIEESQYTFIENMRKLASTPCTDIDARKFYTDLYPESDSPIIKNNIDKLYTLYKYGNGSNFAPNTLYNILQGVTDFHSNNQKSRSDSTKFWNSFYGNSEKKKLDAMNKLLDMA